MNLLIGLAPLLLVGAYYFCQVIKIGLEILGWRDLMATIAGAILVSAWMFYWLLK
jgi:hypothetical protein